MNNVNEARKAVLKDQSEFGNLTTRFSNKFYVYTGPKLSRIYFGDQLLEDGEVNYHTQMTMLTSDLAELSRIIGSLLPSDGTRTENTEKS